MRQRMMIGAVAAMASTALTSAAVNLSNDPMEPVWKLFEEGRDLSALDRLHALAFRKDGSVLNEAAVQMSDQFSPRLNGEIDSSLLKRGGMGPPATPKDTAAVSGAEQRDAIATITKMARNRRIVILNEEHDAPEGRAFGLSVARVLRPLGFNVLAAEAFTNSKKPDKTDMAALAKRGYPVGRTGTYTGDPAFGDFIRQALALGYEPISYEQTVDQNGPKGGDVIDAREMAEASNLQTAMARRPHAKFFIYVGYSHAAKTPLEDASRQKSHFWMAGRLKQATGLDPLSIDQTTLGAANVSQSSRMLRNIVQGQGLSRPVILFTGEKPLRVGRNRDAVDVQVVHPATRMVHGRPSWLETMGRHPVQPGPGLVPKSGRSLVQVFLANEGTDAIPVDQAVLEPGKTCWFMLPAKPVRFVVREHLPAH